VKSQLYTYTYDNKDVGVALASGSFLNYGMVVVPHIIKTLSGITNSYTDNLLERAAGVTLKRKTKIGPRGQRNVLSKRTS